MDILSKAPLIPFSVVMIVIAIIITVGLSPLLNQFLESLVNVPTNNTLIVATRPSLPWLVGVVYLAIIIATVYFAYKRLKE